MPCVHPWLVHKYSALTPRPTLHGITFQSVIDIRRYVHVHIVTEVHVHIVIAKIFLAAVHDLRLRINLSIRLRTYACDSPSPSP